MVHRSHLKCASARRIPLLSAWIHAASSGQSDKQLLSALARLALRTAVLYLRLVSWSEFQILKRSIRKVLQRYAPFDETGLDIERLLWTSNSFRQPRCFGPATLRKLASVWTNCLPHGCFELRPSPDFVFNYLNLELSAFSGCFWDVARNSSSFVPLGEVESSCPAAKT